MRRAVVGLACLASVWVLLAAGPADAHTKPTVAAPVAASHVPAQAARLVAAPAGPGLPAAALVTLATLAVVAFRRPRRALGLALVLTLAVVAAENAVHSVHHLGSDARASVCVLASVSAQLTAALADGVQVEPRILAAPEPVADADPAPLPARASEPVRGRAPPSPVA